MFGSTFNPSQMVHQTCFTNVLGYRTYGSPAQQRIHNSPTHILHVPNVNSNFSFIQVFNRTVLRAIHKINNGWR